HAFRRQGDNLMTVPVEETKQNDDKSHNFEMLRKKLEATEREKQAAQAKLAQYEKEKADSIARKRDADPDDDAYDEPYVDEKRLNKKLAHFEERFGKKVDEVAEQKARAMMEQ